jgi:hypothetical protein
MFIRPRTRLALLGALIMTATLGCDADPDGAPPGQPLFIGPSAAETARIQQFLDERYTAAHVRHSFHTKFSETVDCVDFFAQPGVKALAAQGTPMVQLPVVPRVQAPAPAELADVLFLGQPDDEGHARACPGGSSPLLRITGAQIVAAGGLNAFLRAHTKKTGALPPPVAAPPAPPNLAGYAWVTSTYTGGRSTIYGKGDMTIYRPKVLKPGDHSIAQTWTSSKGPNGTQTVEIGWNVDRSVYNDDLVHLFIYSTTNSYDPQKPGFVGCYNNVGPGCAPFVVPPSAIVTPGQVLSPSDFFSAPQFEHFITTNSPAAPPPSDPMNTTPGWWLQSAGGIIGYYPSSDYVGTMQTQATTFQIGAEIYDQTASWVIPMGSGFDLRQADSSGRLVAYWGAPTIKDTNRVSDSINFSSPASSQPSNYGGRAINGLNFFADFPNIWFGQSVGLNFSKVGDWAPGAYKGECGTGNGVGQPLVGIATATDTQSSHGFLCGQQTLTTTNGSCYARTITNASNLGTTDGFDWDVGALKDECAANEYVQGVAQDTSGVFRTVLCCPGSVNHRSCTAEIFTSSNSPSYGSPDWDVGYLKGNCGAGKYVAGVARRPGHGAVDGLLCCLP